MKSLRIGIRLGVEENAVFADQVRTLVEGGALPFNAEVTVGRPKPSVGGFALPFPPEVTIAVLTAVATATASEIVKTIWGELREFLATKRKSTTASTKGLVIVINGHSVDIPQESLDEELPDAIKVIINTATE